MENEDNAVALSGHRLIVQTTRILLFAGSLECNQDASFCPISKPHDSCSCSYEPMRLLRGSITGQPRHNRLSKLDSSSAFFYVIRNKFQLVADLIKLMLIRPISRILCVKSKTHNHNNCRIRNLIRQIDPWLVQTDLEV